MAYTARGTGRFFSKKNAAPERPGAAVLWCATFPSPLGWGIELPGTRKNRAPQGSPLSDLFWEGWPDLPGTLPAHTGGGG